jgi:hypothetical protein
VVCYESFVVQMKMCVPMACEAEHSEHTMGCRDSMIGDHDMRPVLCCAGSASEQKRRASDATSGLLQYLEPLSDGLGKHQRPTPAQHKPRPAA